MRRRNITAAFILIAFGVWYGYQTSQLPVRTLPHTPAPSFFPWLLTCGLLMLAMALLLQGFADRIQGAWLADDTAILAYPTASLGLIVLYVTVLPTLGFLLTSVPLFAGLMVLAGERRPGWVVISSISIPLVLFLMFRYGFRVSLPRGVLVEW